MQYHNRFWDYKINRDWIKMNWNKYFKEKDVFKRYEMLEKENRLSYDHVDNWLMSLKDFLEKRSKQ